ncbi:hypothetical protein [Roseateles sp. P5_E7]
MQNATRPLKLLLDRLAGVRWAPLAAPVDGALAGPDLQLAAFSPDPFASLQRDAVAAEAVAEHGASPRARRPAAGPGTAARLPRLPSPPPVALSPSHVLGEATLADAPHWRPRPAAPGLVERVPMPWPALPKAREASGVPALETAAVQALIARFAPAADTPPLDSAQLRALAAPQVAKAPSAASADTPPAARQAAPVPAPLRHALVEPTAATAIARRPLPEPPAAADAARASRPDANSLPTPRGRTSALAELLQRWPGTQSVDTDAPAPPADLMPPPAAEFAPMPSAPGAPLSFADLPAAFGTDLPRPQAVASDLQFTRTLERVLLAEVRRQGLEPESS